MAVCLYRMKMKQDEKQTDETQFDAPKEKAQRMIEDVSLRMLVEEAKESILPLHVEQEQYAALAR